MPDSVLALLDPDTLTVVEEVPSVLHEVGEQGPAGPPGPPGPAGPGGVADHALLSHLDYAGSGHIGFMPAAGAAAGGDLSGTYPDPALKAAGPGAGTYGDATRRPAFTLDAQGRVAAVAAWLATPGAANVKDYGADPTGAADSTAAIQAALNTMRGTGFKGGRLYFPPGVYVCSGSLDSSGAGGILWEGASGVGNAFSSHPSSELRYTGAGPRFIDMGQTYGCSMKNLGVVYTSSAFTGHLIDLLGAGGTAGTAYVCFDNCLFYGWKAGVYPCTAGSLLNLTGANKVWVRNCYVGCGKAGVRGAPDGGTGWQTNAVQVTGCNFDSVTSAVLNPEQGWDVNGCCFEGTSVNGAGTGMAHAVFDNHAPYNIQGGLSFTGNWCGDPSADLVSWLENGTTPWYGLHVAGNMFSGAPVSINLSGASSGFLITGNNIGSSMTDIALPAGKVCSGAIIGNRLTSSLATNITNIHRPHEQLVVLANVGGGPAGLGGTTCLLPVHGHLLLGHNPGNAAPTIAAASGAGTGPTLSIAGSDACGLITLTTGTAPLSGNLCQVTHRQSYQFNDNLVTTTPRVFLTPAEANAAGLRVWANLNSSFASWFLTAIDAPAAATTYKWHYLVIG